MSVISALSPSSAFDVRVANGYQRARRLSVMLRLRDRAAPSFLSEQNAPMPMSGIVDCSVRSINNSRYMYPARPIASPQREGRPNHTKKEQDWNIILELAPLKKKIEMSLETSQKRRWETSPGTTAAAVVSLFRQQWPAAMDAGVGDQRRHRTKHERREVQHAGRQDLRLLPGREAGGANGGSGAGVEECRNKRVQTLEVFEAVPPLVELKNRSFGAGSLGGRSHRYFRGCGVRGGCSGGGLGRAREHLDDLLEGGGVGVDEGRRARIRIARLRIGFGSQRWRNR
ncbi:hypothetical protein MUK42_32888 [Musa troglodytarum]|uniref:Uncharacterized protein n=1 Tax=Musa troglodytarum TaxID=320322 RepID=A0A9E7IE79_9LILI|nr:hypothetical protein MUK42_32888 [Musa troglodytarum]